MPRCTAILLTDLLTDGPSEGGISRANPADGIREVPGKWYFLAQARTQPPPRLNNSQLEDRGFKISPPLLKALASAMPAKASAVLCGSSTESSTAGFRVLFNELFEGACDLGLHAGEHVLVGVDGERRVPVPEPF